MVNVDPAHPSGWLVAPDDTGALAEALVEAVNTPGELRARGANALAHARANLSWSGLVPRFEDAYAAAIARHGARP
jgi:glycosyltransferase involved in cell wall biosynthesis